MPTKIIMPQLGESVVEGTVTKWLKHEGDRIDDMELVLEVDTDKVATEIPSPAGGTLLKILIPEGTTVKAGTVLAWIGQPGEALPDSPGGSAPVPAPAAVTPLPAAPSGLARPGRELGFISPVVARLAHDNQLDLALVRGTGEGGRITKKDVLAYLAAPGSKPAAPEPAAWETPGEGDLFRPTELQFAGGLPNNPPPVPPVPSLMPAQPSPLPPTPAPAAGDRLLPLSTIRRSIAEHMLHSVQTAPHVTTVMLADLHKVVAHRAANKAEFERAGVRLTYTAYFAAAAVAALKAFPLVNSSWSEQGILLHSAVAVGIAASLGEEGLIVPVIKGADGLSLLGLARAVNDLAERARAHRLQPDEVRGGTFTITNYGTGGSLFGTPIINQPQCAILGVGAIHKQVVVLTDDAIAVRPVAYLGLTFDHRILDGASGDGFLAKVVAVLENWV